MSENEEKDAIEDEEATPIEVIIKKEETKPEPDFDYDSDQLTEEEITKLEVEIETQIRKRVNKDNI